MMVPKKKKWTGLWLILAGLLSLNSCKSESEIKYEQYFIAGKALYETHCANCHGNNGEGLRQLYPPISQSDQLSNIAFLKCLIKNGTQGKETNMPANRELYDLDIAQIITYINDRWGETKKIIETEEVSKVHC